MQSDLNADSTAAAAGRDGLGRRILLVVAATVVATSAGTGWLVGSNGSAVVSEASILGTAVTVPVTPLAMALYGVVVSGVLLAVLFGLVEAASRAERSRDASGDPDPDPDSDAGR